MQRLGRNEIQVIAQEVRPYCRPVDDHESIRQLLARFIQLRDDKRFEEWSQLFTDDGTFEYPGARLTGRSEIREHVAELLRNDRGKHLCVNSIIDVSGDSATVSSDVVKVDPADGSAGAPFAVRTMGRYVDRLVCRDGTWLFLERRVDLAPFPR